MIYVQIPDEGVALENPNDQLDEFDQGILRKLKRIQAMAIPEWMRAVAERGAKVIKGYVAWSELTARRGGT